MCSGLWPNYFPRVWFTRLPRLKSWPSSDLEQRLRARGRRVPARGTYLPPKAIFVLPFTLLVVLASSTSGDQHFFEIVVLCRPPPHQDFGRARTAGNRFARDDKEPGPSWGKQLPGERPRELPRRDTRALSPAGMSGGKALLCLAVKKSRPHAPSVPMRSAPA